MSDRYQQADLPEFEGHMAPMDEFGTPHVERFFPTADWA